MDSNIFSANKGFCSLSLIALYHCLKALIPEVTQKDSGTEIVLVTYYEENFFFQVELQELGEVGQLIHLWEATR